MAGLALFIGVLLLSLFATVVSLYVTVDFLKDKFVGGAIVLIFVTFVSVCVDIFLIGQLFARTHVCPNCDKISFDNNYCAECGESFCSDIPCSKCYKVNSKDNNYCYHCGERLENKN